MRRLRQFLKGWHEIRVGVFFVAWLIRLGMDGMLTLHVCIGIGLALGWGVVLGLSFAENVINRLSATEPLPEAEIEALQAGAERRANQNKGG